MLTDASNTFKTVPAPVYVKTFPLTSQSPAVSDIAVTLSDVVVVTGSPRNPVCVPDCDPLVLTAVPAMAFAIDVATSNVLAVRDDPIVQ